MNSRLRRKKKRESKLNTSMCVSLSLLGIVSMKTVASSFCDSDFPAVMDCVQELWFKIKPSFPK